MNELGIDQTKNEKNEDNNEDTVIEVLLSREDKDEEKEKERKATNTPIANATRRMSQLLSSLSLPWRRSSYSKVEDEKEGNKQSDEKEKKEKKDKKKSKSRLDVASLNAVTRKMHLSYLLAIACIIIALMVSYLVSNIILICYFCLSFFFLT